jgi:hypothetical protein
VRLDYVADSVSDPTLGDVEWYVLCGLQHYVDHTIPQRAVGRRLRMEPYRVGRAIRALEESGHIAIRRPQEWNPDGSWKGAIRLLTIRKHAIAGAREWYSIPHAVQNAYGRNEATALRLRLHGLQMVVQHRGRQKHDPRNLPQLDRRKAAECIGSLDPNKDADLRRVQSGYTEQRELGFLKAATPEKRQRVSLPDSTRPRIIGATDEQMTLLRALIAQMPQAVTLAIVAKLGSPLPINPLLDALRTAKREGAISDELVYGLEHSIGPHVELDEQSLVDDLTAIDRLDSYVPTGHTPLDSYVPTGHTGSAVPKGEYLKESRSATESRRSRGERPPVSRGRSQGQSEARKDVSEETTVEEPLAAARPNLAGAGARTAHKHRHQRWASPNTNPTQHESPAKKR